MKTRRAKKLRPDRMENAHRVVMEATGQWPKTKPPNQRTDDEKNPDAVRRGRKGGKAKAANRALAN